MKKETRRETRQTEEETKTESKIEIETKIYSKKGCKVSRRRQKRWKRKKQKQQESKVTTLYLPPTTQTNLTSNVTHSMNIESLRTYGFTIDPSLPCWERLADTILCMPPKQWFT
jgi:hypothetical protein